MKKKFLIIFLFLTQFCAAQDTWYGEIALFGGGGTNDIFRVDELVGAGSVTGTGMWTTGVDLRRLFGDHFSLESGVGYSHQYYYTSPAAGIPGEDTPGNFGLIIIPVTARFDFLKWFFADAGIVGSLRTGTSYSELTGLGVTLGAGFQYNFKSDVFISIRLMPPSMLFCTSCRRIILIRSEFRATIGVGYGSFTWANAIVRMITVHGGSFTRLQLFL
jgi:hypothetical protein